MVVDAVSVTFFLLSELLLRGRRLVHISNARVLRYMFCKVAVAVDCKTVRIFAYSSTRKQSNKRSGMRLKTESETGRVRLARA